jgi:hypothetical protein
MGYGFEIVQLDWSRRQPTILQTKCTLYLSYNWSDLRQDWDVWNDLFGRPTTWAAQRIKQVLDNLQSRGYTVSVNDGTNSNWGWGLNMAAQERMGVFMSHLTYFRERALQHPECHFVTRESDNCVIYDKDGNPLGSLSSHSDTSSP